MGTNVYAIKKNIYTNDIFDKYSELAKNHDINGIEKLNEEILHLKEENQVHIGKRSCEWKFLFNHNNWEYYDYTKKSINDFLTKCYRLENEYGEIISVEQFWKEYVDDFKDGFTGRTYAEYNLQRSIDKDSGKVNDPYNLIMSKTKAQEYYRCGLINHWYETQYFKNHIKIPYNLPYRFSNSTNFS